MAEDLEEAYARGVDLLADASRLDRRAAAEKELAVVQAVLDERARSSYIAGPGWFMSTLVGADDPADALARLPLQKAVLEADLALVDKVSKAKAELDSTRARLSDRLVAQARGAEQLDAKRAQAERLAADIERELRTMDRPMAALIEQERRAEEASQRAAFADYVSAARTAGTAPIRDGRASRRPARRSPSPWPSLGSPYVWGAEGPSTFDCSGLTSFAYAAAGVTIPRAPGQYAAYAGMRSVDPPPGRRRPGVLRRQPRQPGHHPPRRHVHRQGHDGGSSLHRRGRPHLLDLALQLRRRRPPRPPSTRPESPRPERASRCCSPCRRRSPPPAARNPRSRTTTRPLHAHWNDPRVARFFWDASPVPTSTVADLIARSQQTFRSNGWGLWAVRPAPPAAPALIGVCGLSPFDHGPGVELLSSLAPTPLVPGPCHRSRHRRSRPRLRHPRA